jgi:co-chaperonin GroES (HSP10)
MIEVVPFGDRLLVKLDPKETELPIGGFDKFGQEVTLTLPGSSSQKSRLGTVLAAGDTCNYFKKGDRIIISFYTGIILNLASMRWNDETMRVLREEEVVAFIKES